MKHKPIQPIKVWYEVDTYHATITAFEVARTGDSMFTTPDGHRFQYRRDRMFNEYEKARAMLLEQAEADLRRHEEHIIRYRQTLEKAKAHPAEKPALFDAMEKLSAQKSYELPTYSNAHGAIPGRVITATKA